MASMMVNRACPQCGGLAIDEDYYKIGERYIYCYCCGYTYIREQYFDEVENKIKLRVEESNGYGMFRIAMKDGSKDLFSIDTPITEELINEYKEKLKNNNEVDLNKSYLVSYFDGKFTVLFGEVPEIYLISYEEYKRKGYLDVMRI
ncbi:hypothetical protein [Neobacillus niacini]|uniref:hypothetical protein n=1 Tax=Neobacillus niacini TaxID=86668 RepID=UPI0021CB061A|nr:hypothetical protein [Neobacillus niacini]MCM3768288.1 hypothetical protein [Neobacillus niacini]